MQAYSGHSGSCSQLRVIFSFYASTIVPALDAVDRVSNTIISKLLPYVQTVTCAIIHMTPTGDVRFNLARVVASSGSEVVACGL